MTAMVTLSRDPSLIIPETLDALEAGMHKMIDEGAKWFNNLEADSHDRRIMKFSLERLKESQRETVVRDGVSETRENWSGREKIEISYHPSEVLEIKELASNALRQYGRQYVVKMSLCCGIYKMSGNPREQRIFHTI